MTQDTDDETVCAYKDCSERATHVFYVTGQIGPGGRASYCPDCAQGYAERSRNHEFIEVIGDE